MLASLALLASLATPAAGPDRPQFLRFGRDDSPGRLVWHAVGPSRFDPARPTLVFVHGSNPLHHVAHLTMSPRLAEALAMRGGPPLGLNVLGWDWNGGDVVSVDPRDHWANAVGQGRRLAASLHGLGIDPARVHLIGQSSGSIVAASAARELVAWTGRPLAGLTLLDPARMYHDVVFGQLGAGGLARRVENFWAAAPSGFGGPAGWAGVRNVRVDVPGSLVGVVWFPRSSHWAVVAWYLDTAADPRRPGGFNASPLLTAR